MLQCYIETITWLMDGSLNVTTSLKNGVRAITALQRRGKR